MSEVVIVLIEYLLLHQFCCIRVQPVHSTLIEQSFYCFCLHASVLICIKIYFIFKLRIFAVLFSLYTAWVIIDEYFADS